MEDQKVTHQTVNGKYRIQIERAASTKGIDGFKVEVNADGLEEAFIDINALYLQAQEMTRPIVPEPAKPEVKG